MSAHAIPSPSSGLRRLRPLARRSDDDLRALAARGDANAFAELYERHHQVLYRYCRSIVRHDEDARDALHSTWANAWAALQSGDRDVPVRPWLFRIAHNEAISVLRRRRDHDDLDDHAGLAGGGAVEDDVALRQQLAALRDDLADLPERQRSALLLRELSGLGHEEIAAVHGITTAAAKQSIYEARRALQEAAEGRSMTCGDVQRILSDGDGRVRRGRKLRAHLRGCDACAAFDVALRGRPANLALLAPPLPAAAAAGILARFLAGSGGSGASGGGVAATGAAASGAAGSLGGSGALTAAGAGGSGLGASGASGTLLAAGSKLGAGVAAKLAVGAAVVAGAGTVQLATHERHATSPTPKRAPGTSAQPAGAVRGATPSGSGGSVAGAGAANGAAALRGGRAGSAGARGAHGRAGQPQGQAGDAHGRVGQPHGQAGDAHGRAGGGHGSAGGGHGSAGVAHHNARQGGARSGGAANGGQRAAGAPSSARGQAGGPQRKQRAGHGGDRSTRPAKVPRQPAPSKPSPSKQPSAGRSPQPAATAAPDSGQPATTPPASASPPKGAVKPVQPSQQTSSPTAEPAPTDASEADQAVTAPLVSAVAHRPPVPATRPPGERPAN